MSTYEELSERLAARRRVLDAAAGEARAVLLRGRELTEEVKTLSEEIEILDRTAILLNSLGEERQIEAQRTIETLVTQGLQTIFDASLSFHIIDASTAATSGIEFVVRSELDGSVVETPVLESRGGGLSATVGFLLRVVVLLLSSTEGSEDLLVLDETFAHVSEEYLPNVAAFLRQIVDKTGVQIILVTHQDTLTENADVVYRFSTQNGRTVVSHV